MKRSILLTLILLTVEWGTGTHRHPNTALAETLPNSECARRDRLGMLVKIRDGEALLRRKGEDKFHLAKVGEVLCSGDRIKIGAKTRASIHCEANNQDYTYPAGIESGAANVCPPLVFCPNDRCIRGRNEIISLQIISPRNTALLNNKPSFIWRAVPGATSYTVVLTKDSKEKIWEKNVNTTEMSYPTDEQPLEPGTTYHLTVTPSPDNDAPPATFKVLDKEEAETVMAAVQQPELDDQVKIPSRVYVYIEHDLRNDAIKTLEDLVNQGKKSDAVYLLLGNLYWEVENFPLAEQSYLKAVELVAPGNLQSRALARVRLGKLYEAMGNQEKACLMLSEATTLYAQAGEPQRAGVLKCKK